MIEKEEGVAQGNITEKELENRVSTVVKLLARGMLKSDIKKACKEKYDVCARTVEDYLSRARGVLREDDDETRDNARAEAAAYYRGVMVDPKVTTLMKLKARRSLDDLYGLRGPRIAVGIQNNNVHAVQPDTSPSSVADEAFTELIDACQTEEEIRIALRVDERREAAKQKRLLTSSSLSAELA